MERLFQLADVLEKAFSAAGIEYRVVGGLAVYLYVEEAEPYAGRLTPDIDILVSRQDLERIIAAVLPFNLHHSRADTTDMLLDRNSLSGKRAVHLIFTGEKVLPHYDEAAPALSEYRLLRGLPVVPLKDLIRMKLTSFRIEDQMHIKDIDEAGLITPEIEQDLPPKLLEQLQQTRSR